MRGKYYFLGELDTEGKRRTPFLLGPSGEKTRFVIFCRRCHRGLCRNLEIASVDGGGGRDHNAVYVEPCGCDANSPVEELAERYAI